MSVHSLARSWWLIVLRGLVSVLLGLAAIIWPTLALAALVFLLGIYLLADGLLAFSAGLSRHNDAQPWWWLLIEGTIGIFAGTWTLLTPGLTAFALLYLIAGWASVTGLMAIAAAIRLRKEIENEGLLALSGILSVSLGMMLVIWPGATAVASIGLIGTYAVISGLVLIGLGFRLWHWQSSAQMVLSSVWVGPGSRPGRHAEK